MLIIDKLQGYHVFKFLFAYIFSLPCAFLHVVAPSFLGLFVTVDYATGSHSFNFQLRIVYLQIEDLNELLCAMIKDEHKSS